MQLGVKDRVNDLFIVHAIEKAYSDAENMYVEGWAATDEVDEENQMLSEEALRETADLLVKDRSTVLFNHHADQPIGTIEFAEYKEEEGINGVWIKALISKTVPQIREMIKEGVLNKFSIKGLNPFPTKQIYSNIVGGIVDVIPTLIPLELSLCSVPVNAEAKLKWYTLTKAVQEHFNKGGEDIMGPIVVEKSVLQKLMDGLKSVQDGLQKVFVKKGIEDENVAKAGEIPDAGTAPAPPEEIDKAAASAEELISAIKEVIAHLQKVITIAKPAAEGAGDGGDKYPSPYPAEKGVQLETDLASDRTKFETLQKDFSEYKTATDLIIADLKGKLGTVDAISKAIIPSNTQEQKKEEKDKPVYAGTIFKE